MGLIPGWSIYSRQPTDVSLSNWWFCLTISLPLSLKLVNVECVLSCRFNPQAGCMQEATIDVSLSHRCFSLSLPLSFGGYYFQENQNIPQRIKDLSHKARGKRGQCVSFKGAHQTLFLTAGLQILKWGLGGSGGTRKMEVNRDIFKEHINTD